MAYGQYMSLTKELKTPKPYTISVLFMVMTMLFKIPTASNKLVLKKHKENLVFSGFAATGPFLITWSAVEPFPSETDSQVALDYIIFF